MADRPAPAAGRHRIAIRAPRERTGPAGRGSRTNESGRFEPLRRVDLLDAGPETGETVEEPPHGVATRVIEDTSRSIIARNRSPDIPFDRSVNPYRGCEHGCSYCYARPTHAYLGHSPGLDFETVLYTKPEAAALLDAALRKPGYRPAPLCLGSNTDPYQPLERRLRITRSVLEVLSRFDHPVTITTKGALVARDLDLLAPMADKGLARVAMSVTTLDPALARAMEPRASTPRKRLEAIRTLSAAGVPVMVMAAPVIPALNDHELEAILEAAARAGAVSAGYVTLRLPLEIKDLFREWLASAVPDRARRVISLMRQMRGGRDYDPQWRTRMTGEGPLAALLKTRFDAARQRHGLDAERTELDCTRFRVPPPETGQLNLF